MEQTTTQRVAGEVRAILGRRDLSRRWLAQQVDMPVTSMNRRLRGEQPFTIDELAAVARALSVPTASLITAEDLLPAEVA